MFSSNRTSSSCSSTTAIGLWAGSRRVLIAPLNPHNSSSRLLVDALIDTSTPATGDSDAQDSGGRPVGPSYPLLPSHLMLGQNPAELTVNSVTSALALFEEDGTNRRPVSHVLQSSTPNTPTEPAHPSAFLGLPPPAPPPPAPMLGIVSGVFLPVLQCIVGIVYFARLGWIIGVSGVGLTLSYLAVAVTCTMITAASMGAILSGGPYYLLSRTLGKEVGGSIGLLYFLSLAFSVATNVIGAVEVLREHILPEFFGFNDARQTDRLTGTIAITAIIALTLLRPSIVNRSVAALGALTFLTLVLMLGSLVSAPRLTESHPDIVNPHPDLATAFPPHFGAPNTQGVPQNASWVSQFALFFPMVTGIMAGVNKSGLVCNPSRAIPRGTLAAILVSTAVYFLTTLLMGAMIRPEALRTQPLLILSIVSWPHPAVGYTATLTAALGVAMQASLGAQGMLRAMARDQLLSFDRWLKFKYAVPLTTLTFAVGLILVGELNQIAPIATQCFLITYAGLNAATALGGFTRTPGWRPTWPLYHWTLSLAGTILCLGLMFLLSWWVALVSLAVTLIVYRVIELHGAKGSWGAEGWWSLALQMAQQNLWRLESIPNATPGIWRPQVLAFLPPDDPETHRHIAALVKQLKKSGGLSIVCACIVTSDLNAAVKQSRASRVTSELQAMLRDLRVEAFAQAVMCRSWLDGVYWRFRGEGCRGKWANEFVETIRSVIILEKALLLVKGVEGWPIAMPQAGTIDVYWIVHDGGILRLLPWLFQRHSVWRGCKLRVFAVAQLCDNSIEMERNLIESLEVLRIQAEAHVLEIGEQDVSEFVHEMTLRMESRHALLEQLSAAASPGMRRRVRQCSKSCALTAAELSRCRRIRRANKRRVDFINTSVRINQLMQEHSANASLIFCNLPAPNAQQPALDYVEYLETLCSGIPRIILVKGNGLEVV
ncbi:amino acid permease-domain-containing protein [Catenaria anguillulae PL171]|uniref:Amino acid permease-domain-containing protein n=1 Tax=Catenaria anguillulae PL171 TaxID=765915 RepID=A0A1Y2HZK8_9FUNG|nr:amino acid permease-domain-containing protein [Catenaria anguillulae PL171]